MLYLFLRLWVTLSASSMIYSHFQVSKQFLSSVVTKESVENMI